MKRFSYGLAFVLALVTVSCSSDSIGTGKTVTDTRTLSPFHAVVISGPMSVDLRRGDNRVTITTDDNVISQVLTVVERDTLFIFVADNAPLFSTMTMELYALEVNSISLNGRARLDAHDTITAPHVFIESRTEIDAWFESVQADQLTVKIHDKADIFFDPSKVNVLNAELNGTGSLRAYTVRCDTANLNMSGAGNAELYVNHVLRGNHSGSGVIRFLGNPRVEVVITGSGKIGGQ